MTPLSLSWLFVCLFGASHVLASSRPWHNAGDLIQRAEASCQNNCMALNFGQGCPTDDIETCLCKDQKLRENYFCCLGSKCSPGVLSDELKTESKKCDAKNLGFQFDPKKACDFEVVTTSSGSQPTTASTGNQSKTTSNGSSVQPTATTTKSQTGTQTASGSAATTSSPASKDIKVTNMGIMGIVGAIYMVLF